MGVRFAILICRSAFRNRLPYMICSEIFESMPLAARDRVYERLYDVLSGKDQAPKVCCRRATAQLLRILHDTKPHVM